MLALSTVLAYVLYLGPLGGLLILLRRKTDGALRLASVIPLVFAADFLATFALCYVVRVEQAAFVRTVAIALAIVGTVAWRRARGRPALAGLGALGRADVAALGVAVVFGVCVSAVITSRYWVFDREWHVPFTSALRAQRMPFRNVYEPGKTLRYHLSGDLFAALLQSLSLATMNASRALAVAHDIQTGLLFGVTALILRATTPWSAAVSALAAAVPYLVGPLGLFAGTMGPFEGISDFSNMSLSFRPHCAIALLMLVGVLAAVVDLAGRRTRGEPADTRLAATLLPLFALLAITDEISTAMCGLTLAALWLRWPDLLTAQRWRGAAVLAAIVAVIVIANLALAGTIAPGGPVERSRWVAPRLPRFSGKGLPLGLSFEAWRELLIDEGALLIPAAVLATISITGRREKRPLLIPTLFGFGALALGLLAFLCFEMNGRVYEGHRFMTAARLIVPTVALMCAANLPRASLRSLLLLAPLFAAAVVSIGYAGTRMPRWHDARGLAAYAADCRHDFGAHLGEPIVPTYVDESIWYPYAGCRPIFAAGHDGPPGVVLAGWAQLGFAGFAKMDREIFRPGAPARVVCPTDASKATTVCRKVEALGPGRTAGREADAWEVALALRPELTRP